MNAEIRNSAIEAKREISLKRKAEALELLAGGMSRKDIAEKIGVSMGSVNVYCNGAGFNANRSKQPKTEKPKTVKAKTVETKKILVSDMWKDLLKKSITDYIQDSVNEIIESAISEIPAQVNNALVESVKAVNFGIPIEKPIEKPKPVREKTSKPKKETEKGTETIKPLETSKGIETKKPLETNKDIKIVKDIEIILPSESDTLDMPLLKVPFPIDEAETKLVNKILPLIPEHETYIEPYFNHGSIFYAKKPVVNEILNAGEGVYNFINFLKNKFPELEAMIKDTPNTDKRWGSFLHYNSSAGDAWEYFILQFKKIAKNGNNGHCKIISDDIKETLLFYVNNFTPVYQKRLENTQIWDRDSFYIINKFDSINSFFYLDNPSFRKGSYNELLEILDNIRGKFLLLTDFRNISVNQIILPSISNNSNWIHQDIQGSDKIIVANYDINHADTFKVDTFKSIEDIQISA
jgi:DNA adenine methylase